MEGRGRGWHVSGWIIVSMQTCTVGLGWNCHIAATQSVRGVGYLRCPRFSAAHNDGPHSGSTIQLALSDNCN